MKNKRKTTLKIADDALKGTYMLISQSMYMKTDLLYSIRNV